MLLKSHKNSVITGGSQLISQISGFSSRTAFCRLVAFTYVVALAACSSEKPASEATVSQPQFIGSQSCESCHQAEIDRWQGSHHQLAMQKANAGTVLGDFNDVTVPYFDTSATFSRRDDRYFATTENANGEQEEFEVTHTFGWTPLQQYLVDVAGGRKQVLQYAWDSRSKADGGQRWYHLYPDEYVGPGDPLHWTGNLFNWNYMCAECHSTNVDLGYDMGSDAFNTTYSEVSVGCEACHGPGSQHLAQAQSENFDSSWGLAVDLNERRDVAWVMNAETGIAERSRPNDIHQQPESCGRCHSRRSPLTANYEYARPLADTHQLTLLDEGVYHADGRILEEVYVYGSFVQSKMYAAGVTCSDCHDPHSGELLAGPEPNDTCSTCHLTAKFASADHSPENVGDCVSCHMKAKTYMGVDDRRDHSFRLPDTDTNPDHYGAIIAAGRNGNANDKLLAGIANLVYPPIARATMLTLLEPIADTSDFSVLQQQLDDPDPLVRIGALRALRLQTSDARLEYGSHLLRDPTTSVRAEAALTFASIRDLLPVDDARAFASAADEYRQALLQSVSIPASAIQLGEFESQLGNQDAAGQFYKHAVRLDANDALARHSLGLFLVRMRRYDEALAELEKAATLDPDSSRFTYVYGVALNSLGNAAVAINVLDAAYKKFPDDFDMGWALATMLRDQGDRGRSQQIARHMLETYPGNQNLIALLESL